MDSLGIPEPRILTDLKHADAQHHVNHSSLLGAAK